MQEGDGAGAGGAMSFGTDATRRYLDEIGAAKLLTAQDEADIGQRIEAGEARLRILLMAVPPALGEIREQQALVRAAKRRMIEANLRLVVAMAKRYSWSDVPLLDRIQDGNIGLMKAVDRFQHRRGCKFSTYAIWWIRQAIVRGIVDRSRTIRLPAHVSDELRRLARAQRLLARALGREPTAGELAEHLDVPLSRVAELQQMPVATISLHAPVGGDDDRTLGDLLADGQAIAADADASRNDSTRRLHRALDTLPARQREVLRLRFGLGTGQEQTLEAIAGQFSLTRERIRQIEAAAISRLRQYAARVGPGRLAR